MRRRDFIRVLAVSAAGWPMAAPAQQPVMPIIGFLNGGSSDGYVASVAGFREGLKEGGYVDGQNVKIEYRWAQRQYDRLPELAIDLARHRVAAIAATGSLSAAVAARGLSYRAAWGLLRTYEHRLGAQIGRAHV